MMYVFEITMLALALLTDFWIGGLGVPFYLTGYVLAYFSAGHTPINVITCAVICGFAADMVYGRPAPLSVPVFLGMLGAAFAVSGLSRRGSAFSAVLSGGGAAFCGEVIALAGVWIFAPHQLADLPVVAKLVFHTAAGMLLYPLTIKVLDFFAGRLDIKCFRSEPRSRLERSGGNRRRIRRNADPAGE